MPHGSPQFTPKQLLDAGRRAEADGKLDLAHQFYGHLTYHYGHTAEAGEGRHGLARIGLAGYQPQLWQMNGEKPGTADGRSVTRRPHRAKSDLPRAEYRVGRAVAALFSGLGWLVVAAALFALAGGLAAEVSQITVFPGIGRGALPVAGVAILAGAIALLLGQAARALFDHASTSRELLAIERARAHARWFNDPGDAPQAGA